jgi:hypothetical protein
MVCSGGPVTKASRAVVAWYHTSLSTQDGFKNTEKDTSAVDEKVVTVEPQLQKNAFCGRLVSGT